MSTPVNFVKINVTSTGTGPLILGSAVPGNRGIEALINGRTYSYSIRQGVSAYEFGRATYLTSPSPRMIRSPLGSSRDGAPISLSVGAQVALVLLVEDLEGLALPGGLAVENNLSDLADVAAARSNMSVYSRSEVDSSIATALLSALKFKATLDCSANPNYPAALVGDTYVVSVAGKIGGASGTAVDLGDWIIAEADNAGGTEAAVGASWGHIEHNLIGAAMLSGAVFTGPVSVPDGAYDEAGWNGSTQVPTKNAVRDKIEAMAAETAFIAANFSSIASTAIPAGVTSVHTLGYASAGDGGGGTYVNDATATSGFAATHPLACTVDGNGRYWRLLPEAGAISVEQLGAVGSMLDTVTTNQRVPIQSASNYALAVNCELLFTMPFYSYWQQARTNTTQDIHASTEGVGFLVDGGHAVWRSTCGGTTLKRRAPAGGDPATWANWPLLPTSGLYWRGGGIFLKGTTSAPTNFSDRSGITLDGIVMDGGITRGSSYGAFNYTDGDGWDLTDKGLWGDGDRYKGDVYILNGSGIIRFRGELTYYQGGDKNDRKFVIRNAILGEGNGSALNIEGASLDIDGLYIYKCSKWSESWGGPNCRAVNLDVYDCINDGFIAPGIPGFGGPPALISGTAAYPTKYVADAYGPSGDGRIPSFYMQGVWRKAGQINLHQWAHFDIIAIDTKVSIGNNTQLLDSSYGLPCKQLSGSITLVADTLNGIANLTITGGQTAGKVNTDEISLDVKVQRTESAATSGYNYPRIYHERSLGPNIRINLDAPNGSSPPVTTLGLTDYMPIYSGTFWDNVMQAITSQNVETTSALTPTSPIMGLTGTTAGWHNFSVITTGSKIQKGQRIRVFNNIGAAHTFLIRPSGDGLVTSDHVVLPLNEFCDLRYIGNHGGWEVLKAPSRYKATAAPTAGTWARGAVVENSVPAGGINEWICTVAGTPGTWESARTVQRQTVASAATVTPTFNNDQVNITALAVACQLLNPTGTAEDGKGIAVRIKDNGTARALTYDTQYRAVGVTLPNTTVANKTLYLGMIYNAADTKWDVVAVAQEA